MSALDCGTNSTRLLVVDASGRTLERDMHITRLGEGVDATGELSHEGMTRTWSVLEDYRRKMEALGVERARLVATSAVRDASNGEFFLAGAARVTGVLPELLSGEEEGRLSFAGATAKLPQDVAAAAAVLVVDIGGGSTELVMGSPTDPRSARVVSLDLGCVRITERHLRHDPPTRSELDDARLDVRTLLEGARASLTPPPSCPVIGLAGTVSTLAALEQGLDHYERARIHHARLGRAQVRRWLDVLSSEPAGRRRARAGMVEGREDVIVGGVLVLDCVMEVFKAPECLVSEDDILDGLTASLQPELQGMS